MGTPQRRDGAGERASAPDVHLETRKAVIVTPDGAVGGQLVDLRWSEADPYAVLLTVGERAAEWRFALELLVDGGGDGDVHVERLGLVVKVVLETSAGWAEVHVEVPVIDQFVGEMVVALLLVDERPTFGGDSSGWVAAALEADEEGPR
jgi:hypothetical protein